MGKKKDYREPWFKDYVYPRADKLSLKQRLIIWLAGGDAFLINYEITVTRNDYIIVKSRNGRGGVVANNHFVQEMKVRK